MKKYVINPKQPAPSSVDNSSNTKRIRFSAQDIPRKESGVERFQKQNPNFVFSSDQRIQTITSDAMLQQIGGNGKEVEVYGTVVCILQSTNMLLQFQFVLGRDREGQLITATYYKMSSDLVDIKPKSMFRFIGRFENDKTFKCFCIKYVSGNEEFRASETRALLSLKMRSEI